ncbi:hypothetical protein [Agrobacterium vaccinii]|uniref:hypothetical protein n=1 Tax=Agrobacterium vaccinii TaxID=2735528 RepID=UPI001E297FFE|nr:hypothetical protein [Agrobacterium vaccinii]UHS56829.1 hypothetical protein HRS00_08450 [Agrobacterium vaccinii]
MAETLPVGLRYGTTYPKLMRSTSVSRYGKRAISFMETSDPFWQVSMRVVALSNADRQKLEAFISRCRDGMVTVLYTPKHVCLPQAYWGNPTAPAILDTGVLSAIAGNQLTVSSVTNGLKLMEGDLIGFSQGDYNTIVRVVQDTTATGGAITIKAEPFLPSYITAGATVVFKNPVMNMRLVPDSYDCPDDFRPTATFTLIEVPK